MIRAQLLAGLACATALAAAAFAEPAKGPVRITGQGVFHGGDAAREAVAEADAEIAREEARLAREDAARAQAEAREDMRIAMAEAREARAGARADLEDAKRDLDEAERDLKDSEADLARMVAGDFSDTMTIEDGKVVKCGDPAKYPGCVPYTDAEKAEILAGMRTALADSRQGLADARRGLDEAIQALALQD